MTLGTIGFAAGFVLALGVGWYALPVALYEQHEQPLQFSHAVHTGPDVGQSCDACHGFDADGRFTGVPQVATCAGCHAEPLGKSPDELRLVEDFVKPGREIPWLIYARQPDTAFFPHATHVKLANLPCERCHGPHGQVDRLRPYFRNRLSGYSRDVWGRDIAGVRTAAWDGMKMGDCSSCHRQHGVVESCLDCHK